MILDAAAGNVVGSNVMLAAPRFAGVVGFDGRRKLRVRRFVEAQVTCERLDEVKKPAGGLLTPEGIDLEPHGATDDRDNGQ